jgi:tetratricopeptide (TPR) repeat protein
MREAGFGGRPASLHRLRTPTEYLSGMELTAFDERIVRHTVQTLTTRWPFVPPTRRNDYRRLYRPTDLFDSLAFAVSGGATWEAAKLRLAAEFERTGNHELAAAEYRGLVRDAPLFEEPLRLLGRALVASGKEEESERVLERALALQPTSFTLNALAALALKRRDLPRGIALLNQSLRIQPAQPEAIHQLSLAYALAGDVQNARLAALRLRQVAPGFPGLAEWLQSLGVR